MSAGDALRAFLAPLLPGWRIQYGRWIDGSAADRYCVIRPAGGLPAALVREPQFTLSLVGALNEDVAGVAACADAIVEAMRTGSGALVSLQAGEPVYHPTADGRPVLEIAVSAITT